MIIHAPHRLSTADLPICFVQKTATVASAVAVCLPFEWVYVSKNQVRRKESLWIAPGGDQSQEPNF